MGWFRRANPTGGSDQRRRSSERDGGDVEAPAEGFESAADEAGSESGKRARAARTPADSVARAQSMGMVARAEYLTSDQEAAALHLGSDGLPDARLERIRDRLLVVTPAGWVNPKSRTAHRYGLHSFQLRGTSHYASALKSGRFTPGTPVRLVREPDNAYDPNAIAVYPETGRSKVGYVPASRARRLAKLLDAGEDLVAVSARGAGPGTVGTVPQILACDRRLFDHLMRPGTRSSSDR